MYCVGIVQKTHQTGHSSRLHPATCRGDDPATLGERARFYIRVSFLIVGDIF